MNYVDKWFFRTNNFGMTSKQLTFVVSQNGQELQLLYFEEVLNLYFRFEGMKSTTEFFDNVARKDGWVEYKLTKTDFAGLIRSIYESKDEK